ncbi:MAG TPA: HlyD family efflux transporter periplasmic adaptor subunit [Bacteroidetes bacterium]|nr:HlyD family efflux transporter periplasmic adaptor subunit [Bacteroidota bacterium]
MRKIILAIIGLLLIGGAVLLAKKLIAMKAVPEVKVQKRVTSVFAETVHNGSTPITVTASGNLKAKNRVELFSEVQGVFESSAKPFKPGTHFSKGQTLLRLNSDEHRANLKAQKSSLYNQVVRLLPDLRLDYPEASPNWEKYLRDFDVDKPLADLPEPTSEKEKLFIAGRNITTTFYAIKNLEERLRKYTVRAPFSGVLTEALVNPGALVRNGQKLGEFIAPGSYEMEVNANAAYADLLRVGKSVELHDPARTGKWTGKVVRVNGKVNQASQTIQLFVEVRGKDLKEGMFLEADVTARSVDNTFEVNRKLLFDGNKLFVIQDTVLSIAEVEPVFFKKNTVVVKGLREGVQLLAKPVPGAYKGMLVKKFNG